MTQIDETKLDDFDLLIGGFPCVAFSVAGHRRGFEDTRGTLFFDLARIAKYKQPKYILCENVKGLVNHDKGNTLNTIIQTLCDIGYIVDFELLNAKYFNTPQNRERVFIVGVRNDLIEEEKWKIKGFNIIAKGKKRIEKLDGIKTFNFNWPNQTKVTTRLRDILESNVDEKFYLSEEKTNKLIKQLEEKEKDIKFVGGIDEGSRWLDNGKTYSRNFKQGNRVYDSDGIATTLTSQPVGSLGGVTSLYQVNEKSKDIEPQMLGNIDLKGHDSIKRVYSTEGVSPTLTTMGGGHREPKIAVKSIGNVNPSGKGIKSQVYDSNGLSPTITTNKGEGYEITEVRATLTPDRLDKRQNGRRFKENDEPAFTVNTQDRHGVTIGDRHTYRIRKLTPLECWRLMGFDDEDFHKAQKQCSNSQLYKQAGNSIVVNVLEFIFEELNSTYFKNN